MTNSRPFVLCGLPLRLPPKDQLLYERRNGSFVLQVAAHPRSDFRSVRTGATRICTRRRTPVPSDLPFALRQDE